MRAELTADHRQAERSDIYGDYGDHPERVLLLLIGRVFLESEAPAMLPAHRWRCVVVFDSSHLPDARLDVKFKPLRRDWAAPNGSYSEPAHPRGVDVTQGGLYLNGAGAVELSATGTVDAALRSYLQFSPSARVELRLPVSGSDRPAVASADLQLVPQPQAPHLAEWRPGWCADDE